MIPEERQKYLDTLEITPGASRSEIREAYLHLKSLYSEDSIVTLPIMDDISPEQRQKILDEIEEAYQMLVGSSEPSDLSPEKHEDFPSFADEYDQPADEGIVFYGNALQEIRERLGIELQEIALTTRIQGHYLAHIENEAFSELPPEPYVRGFVVSYAKYLHLDPKKVASDYMERYRIWKSGVK